MPKSKDSARLAYVEHRRAQILDAAKTVFARKGFDRATIADIAREAGLAQGSIYNYFKNKSDLLVSLPRQIIQPNIDSLAARLLPPDAPGALPPDQVLVLFLSTAIGVMRQNAPILRILLSALPTMKPAARSKYFEAIRYPLGMLQDYLEILRARGILRPDLDPAMGALTLVGMFFPYILLHDVLEIPIGLDLSDETLIPRLVSIFLAGALAENRMEHLGLEDAPR